MDLVAVNNGLVVFKSRHQRREASDGAVCVLGKYVPEVWRSHFLLLRGRVPSHRRGAIICTARLLDQTEARVQLVVTEMLWPGQAQRVDGFRAGMLPLRPALWTEVFGNEK